MFNFIATKDSCLYVTKLVGVFPRKGFGDPPPPPLPPQKSTKLPRARKGPQKQNNRYPPQMLAVKVQYLRVLSIFKGGRREGALPWARKGPQKRN